MKVAIEILRRNRFLLVFSTVGLGVTGSKAADDFTALEWWLALGGCAVLLGLADWSRQLDDSARDLQRSAKVAYEKAAHDLLAQRRRRQLLGALSLGLGLLATSGVLGLT